MKKIIILIAVISIGVWFWTNRGSDSPKPAEQPKADQKVTEDKCNNSMYSTSGECEKYPMLDLPLKYFSVKDVRWGSAGGKGKEGTMEEFTQAALDSRATYQSYPTTQTIISEYSSEIIPATTKKYADARKEIQKAEGDDSVWLKYIDENYKEFGQISVNFLEEGQDIEFSDNFDVDNDGTKETILGLNFIGRADGGSFNAAIIKNGKIIFSVSENKSFIVPADTPNGFYVKWRDPSDDSALCCQTGYIKTRFVYENGKFKPLYEQEVRYVLVGKNRLHIYWNSFIEFLFPVFCESLQRKILV